MFDKKPKKKSKYKKCKCGTETVLAKCYNCGAWLNKKLIKKALDKDYDENEEE